MAEDYEILSETRTDKEITTVFRMKNGTTVTCHEPIHTPEEEAKILSDFALACAMLLHPDMERSQIGRVRVICNENL